MAAIAPCLWFDDNLEEAAAFYTAVFPNSRVEGLHRTTEAGPGDPGRPLFATFDLGGHRFVGLNGGPDFRFTEAVSFMIHCADQDEVDYYWSRLTEGGHEAPCGWLKDRFGLSWQVTPLRLFELLADPDPRRAAAATRAMHAMSKIVIADLDAAADSVASPQRQEEG
ncbi:VOC family protein [Mycolicibacillus trivialis]|uniref:PhnB-like domain-containing protein n=1 Tax=Mycolicibacillus trivialis TaxID=1798 RepID=A0A1X2EQX1_9MYCO|nr:VOC family protein [Mycolicibacillus trivialis]ORX08547.1 hypothetical protein AWC30_01695 [Mycolicibacillus trivialis]